MGVSTTSVISVSKYVYTNHLFGISKFLILHVILSTSSAVAPFSYCNAGMLCFLLFELATISHTIHPLNYELPLFWMCRVRSVLTRCAATLR